MTIEIGKSYLAAFKTIWYGQEVSSIRQVISLDRDLNYPSGTVVRFRSRYPEVDKPDEWPGNGISDLNVFIDNTKELVP